MTKKNKQSFSTNKQSFSTNKQSFSSNKGLHKELLRQMTTLATSGFGLVAALAWNEAIQSFVREYIDRYIPGSGLFSRFFYAIIITVLAVFITYQLTKIAGEKED